MADEPSASHQGHFIPREKPPTPTERIINTYTYLGNIIIDYGSFSIVRKTGGDVVITLLIITGVGRDSSVGIATGYGLEDSAIESLWGRDFPHLSRPALGPTQPPVQWVPGLSRGYRVAGA